MVIRGRTRGNGRQLAGYLLQSPDNDNVQVLEIRGTSQPDSLKYSLIEMSLTSELTKSEKGLYHAQINPAYGEDRSMSAGDWIKAADILEVEAGFTGQKRVMVLHEKKGRIHAHVVWERYDHDEGIMKSDSFNRLAQDRARKEMEKAFNHQLTPDRNKRQPEIKERLTAMWQTTRTGPEFIRLAADAGCQICKGTQRPFMIVDDTGRSFDLARQISGVKTKAIRERLSGIKLQTEKEAIYSIRIIQNTAKLEAAQTKANDSIVSHKKKEAKEDQTRFNETLAAMKDERKQVTSEEVDRKLKLQDFKEQFIRTLKTKGRNRDYEPER